MTSGQSKAGQQARAGSEQNPEDDGFAGPQEELSTLNEDEDAAPVAPLKQRPLSQAKAVTPITARKTSASTAHLERSLSDFQAFHASGKCAITGRQSSEPALPEDSNGCVPTATRGLTRFSLEADAAHVSDL